MVELQSSTDDALRGFSLIQAPVSCSVGGLSCLYADGTCTQLMTTQGATEGTPPTKAALQATSTIPIVFGSAQDPVEKGIVASLAYPGGNVTGMALIADHAKPLELLKEAVSEVSRVVFIYDPEVRPGGLRGGFASNSSKGGTQSSA